MPEVIFPGPEGRLEGRFSPGPRPRAPVALILHPHPQGGGTMNNRIVQALYQTFVRRGFATLRFNFRGVGKSQGVFDNGIGELSDAASALDWVQSIHPEAQTTWIAGGVTTSSASPWMMIPDEGQGARKLKSYMLAGGAIEMKPLISGRRIRSCIPIQAPKLTPATQVVSASG